MSNAVVQITNDAGELDIKHANYHEKSVQILNLETGEVITQTQEVKSFDEHGGEVNDPTPLEIPIGYEQPADIIDIIKRFTALEVRRALMNGEDVIDEEGDDFDDFEVDDEDGDHYERQLEQFSGGRLREHEASVIPEEPVVQPPAAAAPISQAAAEPEQK